MRLIHKLFSFILCSFILSSCTPKKNISSIDVDTLQYQCVHGLSEIIVHDIFNPPVASRFYAYCNLSYYEAVRWKNDSAQSITAMLKGFNEIPTPEKDIEYNFNVAAIEAFFKTAKSFPFNPALVSETSDKILQPFKEALGEEVYNNSIAYGDTVASVILKRAAGDNYKITRGMAKYMVTKETGKWQQTPPEYADAAEPHWNMIKPMLMDSASQCKPLPPPAYSLDKASPYYKELEEVFEVHKTLTPQQDSIAHYWDDNPFVTEHAGHLSYATKKTTPGGHWMGIVAILCKQTNADEIKTARVYALTSCAIFDGFISCWDEKYRSRMVRPVTVIRENMEPTWEPLLQTPPFPEYTSGHSVVSSAAATVIAHQLGDNIAFTDTTELEYLSMQRSFSSVKQAADEACISRLYGGIHYRSAIEQGKTEGEQVGEFYNVVFAKW